MFIKYTTLNLPHSIKHAKITFKESSDGIHFEIWQYIVRFPHVYSEIILHVRRLPNCWDPDLAW